MPEESRPAGTVNVYVIGIVLLIVFSLSLYMASLHQRVDFLEARLEALDAVVRSVMIPKPQPFADGSERGPVKPPGTERKP